MAVFDITSDEYTLCKQWIASQIQAGHSWEDVKNLCVAPNNAEIEFERLQNEELIIPFDILFGNFINIRISRKDIWHEHNTCNKCLTTKLFDTFTNNI